MSNPGSFVRFSSFRGRGSQMRSIRKSGRGRIRARRPSRYIRRESSFPRRGFSFRSIPLRVGRLRRFLGRFRFQKRGIVCGRVIWRGFIERRRLQISVSEFRRSSLSKTRHRSVDARNDRQRLGRLVSFALTRAFKLASFDSSNILTPPNNTRVHAQQKTTSSFSILLQRSS